MGESAPSFADAVAQLRILFYRGSSKMIRSVRWYRRSVLVFVFAYGLANSLALADTIYRETFGRPDGAAGNISNTLADWARFNAAGTLAGVNGISGDGTSGKPNNLAN